MLQIKDIWLGLITAFIIWLIKVIAQKVIDFISLKNHDLTIVGCWYAKHGSYISNDIEAIEVIYIWQHGEKIKYRMEQYVNFEDTKRIYIGFGIMKAGIISSYYYPADKSSKLVGCMNLQVKTKRASEIYLCGSFYEVDERKEEYSFDNYPDDYYKLYRIQLDLKRKIQLMYLKNVFQSFREAQRYVMQYE